MYAIEFESDIKDGVIKLPNQYQELNSKHVKIIALLYDSQMTRTLELKQSTENRQFTDEYINDHWRELIMTGLSGYEESYYKSDQYKEDRGNYIQGKDK